ncbi:MAG: outer membrane protein transport protein [Pseudomonadota bacterium]
MRKTQLAIALAAFGVASGAHATNGMNIEGFGPIAAAMGGASMAYDNGNAAMMNNPATLGLAADGNRLDVAIGFLGPDVKNETVGMTSGGDSYIMPAIGWTKKSGKLSYGVGMFAQGGMGTEFASSLVGDGRPERSELGVGRLMAPVTYNVNDKLTVAGSIDFVWAMLDIKMAMSGAQFGGLVTVPPSGAIGGVLAALGPTEDARLEFSDDSDYTGEAKGTGFAGKLGFTYKMSPTVTLGGSYHSKTNLGDMETGANGATLFADLNNDGSYVVADGEVAPGKIIVRDFQWPETYGLGVSVQATPTLMVAADWKRINWKDVMANFTMTYEAFGDSVTFALPQNWDNQDVFAIGLAYKASNALTLRAGASFSENPIPDSTMHYLFPAIIENHYTVGFGYGFSDTSEVNFSLQYAPEVKQTNGVTVSHSQTSWQLMYSKRF